MSRVSSPSRNADAPSAALHDPTADAAEIAATLAGDRAAFGRLVTRHQQDVANYLWRFTRQRGEWEELVQDVFVEAYLSLRTFRGAAPLQHWLKRIATRVGYRYWRGRAKRRAQHAGQREALESLATATARPFAATEAAETVHALLAQLPPRDRLVLTLLYLEECSVEQIAALTGWSRTMTKVQAFRARGKLKRLMEVQGELQ